MKNPEVEKPVVALVDSYSVDGRSPSHLAMAIMIALKEGDYVSRLDVICSEETSRGFPQSLSPTVRALHSFRRGDPRSLLNVVRVIGGGRYDLAIFNMFPTSFGSSTITNAVGMMMPLIVSRLARTPVAVIYHNSTFTNDFRQLGYARPWDLLRAHSLRRVEKLMFRYTRTFVLLELYRNRINSELGYAAVDHFDIRLMDALGGVYTAGLMQSPKLDRERFRKAGAPLVLLHGSWGPQKDLGFALQTMRILREEGVQFHLVLSGKVNAHFPMYASELGRLKRDYCDVIDEDLGTVTDGQICRLFLSADLALLTYNAPGGVSGVLETAILLGTPVIALEFPEFQEESKGVTYVHLCQHADFEATVRTVLSSPPASPSSIDLVERFESTKLRVGAFLDTALSNSPAEPIRPC